MDASRPAGSTDYLWDTSLLNSFHLEQKELGIVAWSQAELGGATRQLYLPVGVNEASPGRLLSAEVVLVPGTELRELYLTLALVQNDETSLQYLIRDKPLHYGYYPAERGVAVELPPLKTPGIYVLELGAELAGGGVSTERIWFYGS